MLSNQSIHDNLFHLKYNPALGGNSLLWVDLLSTSFVRVCVNMKKISIINQPNMFILVDDEDYDRLNSHRWRLNKRKHTTYAMRIVPKSEQRSLNHPTGIYCHRETMGVIMDKSVLVDHKDGDGLNNQKSNLRICSGHENQGNRKKVAIFSSKYKGVFWNKRKLMWHSVIKIGKNKKQLGYYINEDEAAFAYNNEAKVYFGEFARLNEIQTIEKPLNKLLYNA